MSERRREREEQAGSALIIGLLVVLMLLASSAVLLLVSGAEMQVVSGARDSQQALFLSEAGINEAIVEVNRGVDANGDGLGSLSRSYGGGTYVVTATLSGTDYTVRSTGTFRGRSRVVEVVLVRSAKVRFTKAIVAGRTLQVKNDAFVDSYNSTTSSYSSQAGSTHRSMPRAGTAGHVASGKNIKLENYAGIYGDATPGPTGTVAQGGTAVVTGSTAPAGTFTPPAIVVPPPIASTGALAISSSGQNLTIGPGDFGYDSIALSNDGQLTVRGPARVVVNGNFKVQNSAKFVVDGTNGSVEFYVKGSFESTGSADMNSVTDKPKDATLFMVGGGSAKLTLANVTYMSVYAASSDVTIVGSTELLGGVVGRTVTLQDTARVHFDTDLLNRDITIAGYVVAVWREVIAP